MQLNSGITKALILLGLVCGVGALSSGAYYFTHRGPSVDSEITTNQIQTTTPLTTTTASVTPITTPTKTRNQFIATTTSVGSVTKPITTPITTTTTNTGTGKTIGFKQCSIGMVWACREVSQGMEYDPENPPSEVCGCNPASCPRGQRIITSYDFGVWPDGTGKGIFNCSSEDPPSSDTP